MEDGRVAQYASEKREREREEKEKRKRKKQTRNASFYEITNNYKFAIAHNKCAICDKHSVYIQNGCKMCVYVIFSHLKTYDLS